jgi:hypothetical protein
VTEPTELTPPGERDLTLQRSRVAQWSSLLALAISALALAVGAYQTRLMQTQARASVWPYVVIGYNYAESGERQGFALHVENNGVGPALVRSVQLSLDGKPMQHWSELFPQLMKHGKFDATLANLKGVVIPPSTNRETEIVAIKILDAEAAAAFYGAQDRIKMEICYCSIYGDCWKARWLESQAEETGSRHERASEFDY